MSSLPRAFSKRTVAIAVAAAVSVSGAQVVSPETSQLTAISHAQQVKSAAETVSLEGIFLRGTDTKYEGVLFDPQVDFEEEQLKYAFRFNVDLNAVTPQTKIRLSTDRKELPNTTYSQYGFTYQGTRQQGVPILLGSQQIGSYNVSGDSAIVQFNENLPKNAGNLTLDLDLYRYQETFATADQLPGNLNKGNRLETALPVKVTRTDGSASSDVILYANNDWYSNFYVAPDYTKSNFINVSVLQDPSEDNRIEINGANVQSALHPTQFRESVTITVEPDTSGQRQNLPLGKWAILKSALEKDNLVFNAYEAPQGDTQRRTPVAIPNGMDYSVSLTDNGQLTVTFTNVPAGIAPEIYFKKIGVTNYVEDAMYGLKQVSVATDPASANIVANSPYYRPVKKLVGGNVKLSVKSAVSAKVNGSTTAPTNPILNWPPKVGLV